MAIFRNLPIRQRIIAVVAMASVVAMVITAVATAVYESTSFQSKALRDLDVQADLIRGNVKVALSFVDSEQATENLEALGSRNGVRAAAVYRKMGKLATYVRPGLAGYAFPVVPRAIGHRFQADRLELWEEIRNEGELVGYLFIDSDLPSILARLPQYGLTLGAVLIALLSSAVVLLVALRPMISDPIRELSLAAHRVTDHGDFTVRVEKRAGDEIGQLTDAFNEMLGKIDRRENKLRRASEEQRQLEERLTHAQKMESIGRLAGGVAHDFNNFLTVISGCVELMRDDLTLIAQDQVMPLVDNIEDATRQAAVLTRQLLAFARKQIIEPRTVDPSELVGSMKKMLRTLLKDDIELNVVAPPDAWPVRVDPGQMTQVLMNLAVNAQDAMPTGGELTIKIENRVIDDGRPGMAPGEYVWLSVTDNGEGMTDQTRQRLFEPFFTTKDHGKGTGLGLATCYGIVKQSDGHIWVESEPGRGSTFFVALRRCEPDDPEEGREPVETKELCGMETVLVVEDSPLVRETTGGLLRAHGYNVIEADGGVTALRLVEDYPGGIDLLVTDVVMPQMSGREVAQRLRERIPRLKVLFVSGYVSDEASREHLVRDESVLLQKPFTSEALASRVRDILDA